MDLFFPAVKKKSDVDARFLPQGTRLWSQARPRHRHRRRRRHQRAACTGSGVGQQLRGALALANLGRKNVLAPGLRWACDRMHTYYPQEGYTTETSARTWRQGGKERRRAEHRAATRTSSGRRWLLEGEKAATPSIPLYLGLTCTSLPHPSPFSRFRCFVFHQPVSSPVPEVQRRSQGRAGRTAAIPTGRC